jgi:uncharacterized membrane protein
MQVTKVKLEQKRKEGIAEARSGRRSPVHFVTVLRCAYEAVNHHCSFIVQGSVWGSGLAAILCATAALLTGDADFWRVRFGHSSYL